MLHELRITGLGVIDDLDLELHAGLNVLTGETGTGKTMVTVGLGLALGERGAASLVRPGAGSARIQARFDAPEQAGDWAEDGEVILARTVSAEGKSAARIGGQLATASALAQLGQGLVEIHGQHQAQRLLSVPTQTAFLDRFAGDAHLVALGAYREAYEGLQEVRTTLDALRAASRDRERELDLLAYQVHEIEAVAPHRDETPSLAAEEARLSHVERLLEETGAVDAALGGDDGAADAVGAAAGVLESAATLDPQTDGLAQRARALAAELTELARDVRGYRETLLADPARLQEVHQRLAALKGLQRKYGETDADVLAFLREASSRLASLTGADERLQELGTRAAELAALALERASRLSAARAAVAPALAEAIEADLASLGMPGATVQLRLEPYPDLAAGGAEYAELWFAGGPGQPLQPLAKAASGGELSRTMLACRNILADLDDVPTLVFDEVDAGIGGEAGLAVGRRLAALAAGRQVLVVTHLPQIACFADRHVRVRKEHGLAAVEVLDDTQRVEELSRMLAGMAGSEAAASHAEELIEQAALARSNR